LTSVAVTPGASAADAGDVSAKADVKTNANATCHVLNIWTSPPDLSIRGLAIA